MAIQSKFSTPIPTIGIPDFVFKSRDAPLSESPLLISAEDPERFLSLSSYRDWSCRFAVGLKASGVKVGDRVFLASHNTIYNAIVFMGTVMAGAIFVGIQATYSVEDLAKQLEQVGPQVVLATEGFMPKLLKAFEATSQKCEKVYLFDERVHGGESHWTKLVASDEMARDFTWESLNSNDAAMRTASLIYSSGSTGFPKGVELSHYGMIASVVQSRVSLAAMPNGGLSHEGASAPLCYMSMSQVVGQISACVNYPGQNQPIVIANRGDFISVMEYVSKLQTTSLLINPSFLVAMNKRPEMRERIENVSSLHFLALIGSPVDHGQYKEFINRWTKKTGRSLATCSIYGMTELGGGVFFKSMDNEEGRTSLFANLEAKVVDFDGDGMVRSGTAGELCLRGANVAKGYWQNPKATEKSFMKDGWLRTGDAAVHDRFGNLSVLARVQDLIRVDDRIIIPLDMERVLLRHPDVHEAVVCGVSPTQDASLEETPANGKASRNQSIRAYIVKDKESNLTAQDIDGFLAQEALAMENLSGGVVFLDSIPKTTVSLEPCSSASFLTMNPEPQTQQETTPRASSIDPYAREWYPWLTDSFHGPASASTNIQELSQAVGRVTQSVKRSTFLLKTST